jgi:hypothetical protein
VEWIARQVTNVEANSTRNGSGQPATLGELIKDKIGVYRSGRATNASERVDELFLEGLEQKRNEERG